MTSQLDQAVARGLVDFRAEQKRFDIGGVKVGGAPGVRPAVLIGSIFYHGHDVIVDEDRGEFDADEAERQIRLQDEFAQKTGNPCMLDVVGASPQAIQKHLAFAAGVTQMPLLVDGTTTDVRLAGLRYMREAGLIDRTVYNSIQPQINDEELAALREAGVQSAIILTYTMEDFTASGRIQAVTDLLPRVNEAGVRQLLVDTCVLDLASLGQALGAIIHIKDELGLPAGGGVHNAVGTWRGLKSKMGKQAVKPCIASAAAAAVAVGADFVLYGPVEDAPYVFPAVAMVDTALSQNAMDTGSTPDDSHPRFRIG